jgi:hypothetical protein
VSEPTRAGEPWLAEEDERLRELWLALIGKMGGRSHNAVRQRINRLAEDHYHVNWPLNPAAPTMFQVVYEPTTVLALLHQQFGFEEASITRFANRVSETVKLPHYFALSVVERLIHQGYIALRTAGTHRFCTIKRPQDEAEEIRSGL